MNEKETIVILDNQEEELIWLSELFENENYEVNIATNWEQLLFCLDEEKTDLLVINFYGDVHKKKEVFLKIRGDERYFGLPILGLFREEPLKTMDLYLELGLDHICTYPFSEKDILIHANQLIDAATKSEIIDSLNQKIIGLKNENAKLKTALHDK